jgi:PPOX class probable F420-dependent enzyme
MLFHPVARYPACVMSNWRAMLRADKEGVRMSNSNLDTADQAELAPLKASSVALLTTFRRNGVGVGTPVGVDVVRGKAYFTTWSTTGKIKRIANDPRVTLAPSTRNGKPIGPTVEGAARRLEGAEAAQVRTMLGVGLQRRLWEMIYKVFLRAQPVICEVTPVGASTEKQR